MLSNYTIGIIGEYIVILIYKICFYQIVAYRKRNYLGEIDIIAKKGKVIVFIEVKTRSNDNDDVLLSKKQQTRIKNAALLFIQKKAQYQNYDLRFDLALIRRYRWPLIIKNAW